MTDKPLDKMTVKELREIAKKIPELTGVHGMNKADLLTAIKKAKGIKEAPKKKIPKEIKHLKDQIRDLKTLRQKALQDKDKKMAHIYKRRISRLKKKTRKAA